MCVFPGLRLYVYMQGCLNLCQCSYGHDELCTGVLNCVQNESRVHRDILLDDCVATQVVPMVV